MTANFGCCERRTMESQPSLYNEERNILRLRAWEQRNQETSQTPELNTESAPLFGQPYKTNKGDELSNRIQRMLGSYEDVNCSHPLAVEPLPIPVYLTFTQSDRTQTNKEKTSQPPFHHHVNNVSNPSQRAPSSSGYPPQPTRTSTPSSSSSSSSPNLSGHLSTFPAHKKNKVHVDLGVQEMSPLSPDVKPLPFLRSSDHENADTDTKDTFDRQASTHALSELSYTMDVSTVHMKLSPLDPPQPHNKGNTLPSQTFPSLLSSKQPSVVMTQKPTAYVRPMDGQDQLVSESPELKPSPEPYTALPELPSKSDQGKRKELPQYLETKISEAQCVEEILKEMTHSWPPLLTAIHTPGSGEPSKSPFSVKEAEHVSSCPGQRNSLSPIPDPPKPTQQNSPLSLQAAPSRAAESGTSSDSESSSRSESDSESAPEELPQPSTNNLVKSEPNAPAVTHGEWQLGNWIRPTQSSRTESQSSSQASNSLAHKQPQPTQSIKHSGVEVVDPTKDAKPQLSSHKSESSESLGKPQLYRESLQDNHNQQGSPKPPSADWKSCSLKLSCTTVYSKSAESGHSKAAQDVVAPRDKEACFIDKPKVKTKTGHSRKSKDSGNARKDSKRASKHKSLSKGTRSEPEVRSVRCLSCGVGYPNPCSCPTQSPAQPDQLPLAPSVTISCKPKSEEICQTGTKIPHKTTNKHLRKTKHAAKSTRSLLVRIDLSLLSRVPQSSGSHQEKSSKSKRSELSEGQQGGGGSAATKHKLTKSSKKSIPQNAEVETKTVPRKKQKLENKNTSSSHASVKLENSTESSERKKAKNKPLQQPVAPKDSEKSSKLQRGEALETSKDKEAVNRKNSQKHKRKGKQTEHEKKLPKKCISSSLHATRETLTKRPLVRFEDRQHPVKHYIKEAKKLKHKADAEADKVSKAFFYLEAAMFFVESGIAMERDPQISMSSYTMFAETMELLKFVLKLKSPADPSAPPSEKDFIALCLKSQSLLQMAMFRHKHRTALKYSKMLTDHFHISAQKNHDQSVSTSKSSETPSPMPSLPSPANTSTSSGPGSTHSSLVVETVSSTVVVPQSINQVALTYVNITTLFLSAHDIWEQAEELAHKGSGLLAELDTVLGPLSLMSSMSSMVRYVRQGVHWLRLDNLKVK